MEEENITEAKREAYASLRASLLATDWFFRGIEREWSASLFPGRVLFRPRNRNGNERDACLLRRVDWAAGAGIDVCSELVAVGADGDFARGDVAEGVGVGVIGAISFAIRFSMKVRKVKETLWEGDAERVSSIDDCICSLDGGSCCLDLSRSSFSCSSRAHHRRSVMIPSRRDRRKLIKVSASSSVRYFHGKFGGKCSEKGLFVSIASLTSISNFSLSLVSFNDQVCESNGQPGFLSSSHGASLLSGFVSLETMPHSATDRSVCSAIASVNLNNSRGPEDRELVLSALDEAGNTLIARTPSSGMQVSSSSEKPKDVGNQWPCIDKK